MREYHATKTNVLHGALLSFLLTSSLALSAQQEMVDLVSTQVTRASVEGHIKFLADDLLKGRETPSEGQDMAALYISTHFRRHGLKPLLPEGYLQPVHLLNTLPADEGKFVVGDSVYYAPDQFLQLSGGNVDIDARIVFVDYGTAADFEEASIKGKIVVARGGRQGATGIRDMIIESRLKSKMAREGGALALVELYNSAQTSWSLLQYGLSGPRMQVNLEGNMDDAGSESNYANFWIEDLRNVKLDFFSKYKGKAQLVTQGADSQHIISHNVVAWVEGTDPQLKNEYVVYSAHYDHVGVGVPDEKGDSIYNGTRDNAIGTMTVLEAAAYIAKHPLKRSAVFVLFTAEEKGLLGSEWFVANPPIALKDIVFCFNSDNAGYNDTSLATIVGLTRTTAGEHISMACGSFGLNVIEDPVPSQNFFDRSDQVNFARKGIPSIMYSMGLTAMDEEVMKYYHRPADNPDSVDYEYLLKFTRAYVLSAAAIGNGAQRPYWIEGDKYFETGERLYRP